MTNYRVIIDEQDFQVRTYDDEPGEATVVSPATAQQMPEARRLVRYVAGELGCRRVKFYHGPAGAFQSVDPPVVSYGTPPATRST